MLKIFYYISFIFLLFSWGINASNLDDVVEVAVFHGDIERVKQYKHTHCYAKLWLDYIDGKIINPTTCQVCSTKFSTQYNCAIFAAHSFVQHNQFSEAAMTLQKFISDNHEQLTSMPHILEVLSLKIKKYRVLSKKLTSKVKASKAPVLFDQQFRFVGAKLMQYQTYTIDSAAGFSTTIQAPAKNLLKAQISTFSGAEHLLSFGPINLLGQSSFAYYGVNENLMGIYDIERLSVLESADNRNMPVTKVDLFRDQNNFFFQAVLRFAGNTFNNVNVCLDTGAKSSVFMPKLYKKTRHLLRHKGTVKFSVTEVVGKMETLGKVVDNSELLIGDTTMSLTKTPIFYRASTSFICDIVLGRDVLSKTTVSFSLKERYWRFIKNNNN